MNSERLSPNAWPVTLPRAGSGKVLRRQLQRHHVVRAWGRFTYATAVTASAVWLWLALVNAHEDLVCSLFPERLESVLDDTVEIDRGNPTV